MISAKLTRSVKLMPENLLHFNSGLEKMAAQPDIDLASVVFMTAVRVFQGYEKMSQSNQP